PAQRVALNVPTVATQSAAGGRGGRGGRGGAAQAPPDSLTILHQQIEALEPAAEIRITRAAAAQLFGRPSVDGLTPGITGGTVTASLDFIETPSEWGRNVVAIIPGSDPV